MGKSEEAGAGERKRDWEEMERGQTVKEKMSENTGNQPLNSKERKTYLRGTERGFDSTMARWKRPFDSGDIMWAVTDIPPRD